MKQMIKVLAILVLVPFLLSAQHKFVGYKMCAPCHKGDKKGKQFEIWQGSKHAEAYKSLTSAAANDIAKKKGLTKAAAESPECLECHGISSDANLVKDGVQCENCHAAGSDYKNMAIMKDKAKAIAAGLNDLKDEAAIEKMCKTCHNAKSPTAKEFKFKEMYAKIQHPTPKG
jgi:hypothetical protein